MDHETRTGQQHSADHSIDRPLEPVPELVAEPIETDPYAPAEQNRKSGFLGKLGSLGAIGLLILTFAGKLKFFMLLALKVKFFATGLTMLVSIGAYALLFPLWFAVGLVALLLIHEVGHVIQLRREGVPATAPMFIPFLGAFVGMKELPKDAAAEARVGLAGPVVGTAGALLAWGVFQWTGNPLFLGLAYIGFLLNLFNLLPTLPLDGGRAMAALSPTFWFLGLAGALVLLVFTFNPILLLVLIMGGIELWHRFKARKDPEEARYYEVAPKQRLAIGATYLGLVACLVLLMSATYVPNPTSLM